MNSRLIGALEKSAQQNPTRIAVEELGLSVTFEQLFEQSNALARTLYNLEASQGEVVAVSLHRSTNLVVAILAILRVGAAFLAIDPGLPPERREIMIVESGARLLITSRGFATPPVPGVRTVYIDKQHRTTGLAPVPAAAYEAEFPAYVMYTSGSTGSPKGILIPHRGLENHVSAYLDIFNISPEDRILQFASQSFDAFVSEVFTSLMSGAVLVITPSLVKFNYSKFIDFLSVSKVSIATLTPSYLSNIANSPLGSLRTIISAGEPLTHHLAAILRRRVELYNAYGPAEASICSTVFRCDGQEDNHSTVPIGRPIPGVQIYVLTTEGDLLHEAELQEGEYGECCIAGSGVALGYLGENDSYSERLLCDPSNPNVLVYRSGDVVTKTSGGNFEFLGRIDDQVKINGIRVEPREVESQLERVETVKKVQILGVTREGGQRELWAYVIPLDRDCEHVLREAAKRMLPRHMIPTRYIFLSEFPETLAGKIDRERLLNNQETGVTNKAPHRVPMIEGWEQRLTENWKEVLELDMLTPHADFRDLGGDSLATIAMITLLEDRHDIALTFEDVYNNPTIAELSALVSARGGRSSPRLVKVKRQGEHSVSSAQRRLYFLQARYPQSVAYNVPTAYRFSHPLSEQDIHNLESGIRNLVSRHEMLRTSFVLDNRQVKLHLSNKLDFAVQREYISKAFFVKNQNLIQINAREFIKPFDLSKSPLFRVVLLTDPDGQNVLLFDFHHIISDEVSFRIIIEELNIITSEQQLASSEYDYIDYIEWQGETRSAINSRSTINYWKKQFSPPATRLVFPSYVSVSEPRTQHGGKLIESIGVDQTQRIKLLARNEGVSLFSLLLGAYALVLNGYTASEDIVIGCPMLGRSQHGLKRIVGMFVETLPIRVKLSGEQCLGDVYREVDATVREALAHPCLFEDIVRITKSNASSAMNPLFDVMFSFRDKPLPSLLLGQNSAIETMVDSGDAMADLVLEIQVNKEGFICVLQYSSDVFSQTAATSIISAYRDTLLRLSSPNLSAQCVAHLPVLSNSDQEKVLYRWNDTNVRIDGKLTLTQLIGQAFTRHSNKVAVVCCRGETSYGELDRRSREIAWELRESGIGSGALVGILLMRSVHMVVAAVGILRAGCVFVPLDPNNPSDRIKTIIQRAGLSCIITELELADQLSDNTLPKIYIDAARPRKSDIEVENVDIQCSADSLAYIIHTSGSTGFPKGVEIRHKSVVNLIDWAHKRFRFTTEDTACFISPFAFDLSIFDIFGLLTCGGKIRIISDKERHDPVQIANIIRSENITFWNSTPGVLQYIFPYLRGPDLNDLRLIFLSGDWIPVGMPGKLKEIFPRAELIALGGATEATVWSNFYHINKIDDNWSSVPYGRPIQNSRYYILDRYKRPCPVGVVGELYIAGICLAVGYHKASSLTAAAFMAMSFDGGPSQMLYRTGDMARFGPNGIIQLIGRIDGQVKIRGYRVEIGEIEAALGKCPEITQCAVVATGERQSLKLVAYVVRSKPVLNLTLESWLLSIREHLSEILPDYMVPGLIVPLEALPVTENGKLDRQSLSQRELTYGSESANDIDSENPIEQRLHELWREVLGVTHINSTDSFFDIGGDSLSAVELYSLMLNDYEVKLEDIFRYPTIQSLAKKLDSTPSSHSIGLKSLQAQLSKPTRLSAAEEMRVQEYKIMTSTLSKNAKVVPQRYEVILLTGGTGLVGLHLAHELSETSDSQLFFLVRGTSRKQAETRFYRTFLEHFGVDALERLYDKSTVVLGDIRKPKFGLAETDWNLVQTTCDCVIHGAALVKHHGDSARFKDVNIDAMNNVVDLCVQGRSKKLHYLSTIAVMYSQITDSKEGNGCSFLESDMPMSIDHIDNPYVYSKCAAEMVVHNAVQSDSLDAYVYRIGNVTFNQNTGRFVGDEEQNSFHRVIRALSRLGQIPVDGTFDLELTSVDQLARAITLLVFSKTTSISIRSYHLQNPNRLSGTMLLDALQAVGSKVSPVDQIDFFKHMENSLDDESLRQYVGDITTHHYFPRALAHAIHPQNDITNAILNSLEFSWSPIPTGTLVSYLGELKDRFL